MAYSDKFEDLHHLIINLEYVITDSEDKDKVYAVIDRLIKYHNYVSYGHEYSRIYFDTEVHAIIEDCGFDEDWLHLECGPPGEYRVDVLAELGRLTPEELHTVERLISDFKQEKQND